MTDWVVTLSFQARCDLFGFPWREDIEVGGVLTGRWEKSGIHPVDTGKDLFIRRAFPADLDGDESSVKINFAAVSHLETMPGPSRPGSGGGGRFGADDPGLTLGDVHSHPGFRVASDRTCELSGADVEHAATLARAPDTLTGGPRPWLSVIATSGEGWSEGMPVEDWGSPNLDPFLVFPDRSIIRPRISLMSEVEWAVEEKQRELLATGGGN